MKIAVSANGVDLDAPTSPIFGRAPNFLIVDTESMAFNPLGNPAMGAAGGAGVRAAQFVVEHGVEAVISGNVGPNAFDVLQAADVPVYLFEGGTVRQAVEDCKAGTLQRAGDATSAEHSGMRVAQVVKPAEASPEASREAKIAALKVQAKNLRAQLAQLMEQVDQLEKEQS
jgi:predicted Fe-Mo cluster-binding NifX family protein